jgi:methionyl aminopeptidase
MPIPIRSPREINAMAEAGRIAWSVLGTLAKACTPGARTGDLDALALELITRAGAQSLFMGYQGPAATPFPAHVCISINEELVHGIPGDRLIRPGDAVKIDVGIRSQGWCADCARTILIPPVSADASRLHTATLACLERAIALAAPGVSWSSIVSEVAAVAHSSRIALVEPYAGHGVGRELHEPPRAPLLTPRPGGDPPQLPPAQDFILRPGMCIAIEPIGVLGSNQTLGLDDGWTVVAADRSLGSHEERTVAIVPGGCRILTAS